MTAPAQWGASFAAASLDAMRVYDEVFVPRLFVPWAKELLDAVEVAGGETLIDVACGPGTVARLAAERIGAPGHVTACDLSPAMLAIAQSKPAIVDGAPIEYVECPADVLRAQTTFYDVGTCQQGLQFFPDRGAALAEMRRVLRPGGRLGIAVWCAIEESPPFAALASALHDTFGDPIAAEYRNGPWGLTDLAQLGGLVEGAGFRDVHVSVHRLPVVFEGGADQVLATLAASGVAAHVAAANEDARKALARRAEQALAPLTNDGEVRSHTTSHIATATA
jgi:ubiquinone/menaquinone biosynthesis C-methylase UbiE